MLLMHYDDLCAPTSSADIKLHQYWEIDIKLNCPNQCHVPQFYIRSPATAALLPQYIHVRSIHKKSTAFPVKIFVS